MGLFRVRRKSVQDKLEAAVFRMVIYVEGECDIERRITWKELLLLDYFQPYAKPSHLKLTLRRQFSDRDDRS